MSYRTHIHEPQSEEISDTLFESLIDEAKARRMLAYQWYARLFHALGYDIYRKSDLQGWTTKYVELEKYERHVALPDTYSELLVLTHEVIQARYRAFEVRSRLKKEAIWRIYHEIVLLDAHGEPEHIFVGNQMFADFETGARCSLAIALARFGRHAYKHGIARRTAE